MSDKQVIYTFLTLLFMINIIAVAASTAVKQETVQSQYGAIGNILGVGERIIKTTYDDGTTSYQYISGATQKLFIADLQPKYTVSQGATNAFIRYSLYGISCGMAPGDNKHTITAEKITTGKVVYQESAYVPCGNGFDSSVNIHDTFSIPGDYQYRISETITVGSGAVLSGDRKYVTVTVPGSTSTPGYTPAAGYTPYTPPISSYTPPPAYTEAQPTPTPAPGYTPAPAYTQPPATQGSRPKPVIIPPVISDFLGNLFKGLLSFLGLSISGGDAVTIQTGKQYSTPLTLNFTPPDTDYTDGSYQAVFAEWFVADSAQAVKYESGWTQLTAPPYAATASFTPQTPGKYYLIAVVIKQNYTWKEGTGWTNTEAIETKEVQVLTAQNAAPSTAPAAGTQPATTSKGVLSGLWSWIMGLFGW